jgi:trigger factor
MQVTETLSEGLKRGFAITVPASDIEDKRTKRLTELGKTVKLPGFRPGKVPMTVVRQRFGTAVMAEVMEESVNAATQQVLTDRGLRAATQPKVDVTKLEDKQDLEFTVELELLPEIPMPNFAAIQLTRLKAAPGNEAIDKALGEIAKRQREYEPATDDRGAQPGDRLTIDFEGKVDGVPFPGGAGSDMPVEIGGSGFIPGFSEGMEGMKPGEHRQVPVTFPEGYHAKELAGKAATFDVTAKSLQQPKEAAIDDALAAKIGFENLDELRTVISQNIQREYDGVSRMRIKRDLLDALASAATFPVPESMVEAEFSSIWQRVEADLKGGQLDDEDKGKDEETLKAEYRAIAERRVRLGLLLSEIGRANGIQVGTDEMTRAMRTEASRYPGQEQQVMEFFRKNPQAAEGLRGPIFEDKVVDFILELAKVEEKSVTPEELSAQPETGQPETAQPETATA